MYGKIDGRMDGRMNQHITQFYLRFYRKKGEKSVEYLTGAPVYPLGPGMPISPCRLTISTITQKTNKIAIIIGQKM